MRRGKAFLFSIHRILGSIVCLFFLMWFVSGLVLVYHPFPNVPQSLINKNRDALPDSLPDVRQVVSRLGLSESEVRKMSVTNFQNQLIFSIKTKDSLYTVCSDTTQELKTITKETIQTIATKWVDAPIQHIDTLTERDQWIMYSRYLSELPIYKLYFDDQDQHQLYISSKNGDVLQFTTADQRFWAWVGAIPHKFYIPALRKNTDAWISTLTISGFVALAAALSGMILGFYATFRKYKSKKKLGSPYKKLRYRWHHILGLFFGIFLITWSLSGAMALQKIPQWIIKTHGDYRVSDSKLRGKPLTLDKYVADCNLLRQQYPALKKIEWANFRKTPVYNVVVGDQEFCIDASSTILAKLCLTQSQIEDAITSLHKNNEPYSIHLIDQYEEYYLPKKKELPLPVYKIEVSDPDHSCYYIDPKTGDFHYLNKSRKAKKWLFSGLHYLHIKCLVEKPVLWTIIMWTLCLGGSLLCLSGIWMSVRYVKKCIVKSRIFNMIKTSQSKR